MIIICRKNSAPEVTDTLSLMPSHSSKMKTGCFCLFSAITKDIYKSAVMMRGGGATKRAEVLMSCSYCYNIWKKI